MPNASHKPAGIVAPTTAPAQHLESRWPDATSGYALLDTGEGRKLERLGGVTLSRPEPQALWSPHLSAAEWAKADATFLPAKESGKAEDGDKGEWQFKPTLAAKTWPVTYRNADAAATAECRLTGFHHIGLFPEQSAQWDFACAAIAARRSKGKKTRLLNLFGYTGMASLLAVAAGAEVTHVDASKKSNAWGRENQAHSGLAEKPIRWLLDDATKFVARESRRKSLYDAIILDPPKFGRGPEGETWDLFTHLPALLRACTGLLTDDAAFLILTVYAVRLSYLSIDALARAALQNRAGTVESGEVLLRDGGGRFLSTSLYTRWRAA